MREVSKLVINALLAVAVTFLTGCSSIVFNSDTAINNQSNDGYVALSGDCPYFEAMMLLFKNEDPSGKKYVVPCRMISSPTQWLLKLPAGKYAFYHMTSGNISDQFDTTNFNPIEFDVIADKVVYLGRFAISLVADENNNVFIDFKVSDESQTDIPWFLQNFKNIPQSAYIIKPLYLNPDQDISYPTTEQVHLMPMPPIIIYN